MFLPAISGNLKRLTKFNKTLTYSATLKKITLVNSAKIALSVAAGGGTH